MLGVLRGTQRNVRRARCCRPWCRSGNELGVLDRCKPMGRLAPLLLAGCLATSPAVGSFAAGAPGGTEDLDVLIHQLGNDDERMRTLAGRRLTVLGLPAVPKLIEVLRRGNQLERNY